MLVLHRYPLYWTIMHPVSGWYEPHTYQIVKLIIITVSILNMVASSLALFSHMLYSCGHNSTFWLCHPTPLLLVEGGLTLAFVQMIIMIFLGRQSGLMGTQDMLMAGIYMVLLISVSWVVGEHFQKEKKLFEDKLLSYETVPESEEEEGYDNLAVDDGNTQAELGRPRQARD